MEFLIIGIVSALNLIVIVHKFRKNRVEDGVFDSILFTTLATLFSGSYAGMVVAMISSLIVSIYLWTHPPTFFRQAIKSKDGQSLIKDAKTFVSSMEPAKPKRKNTLEDLNFD